MKYGIISDIHGNLSALEVALRVLGKNKIDKLVCLGDVVGYGPQPNECVKLTYDNADIVIAGNHDYAALGKTTDSNFNLFAKAALDWTRKTLTDDSIQLLLETELKQSENNILFVHATPRNPEYWNYIPSLTEASSAFLTFNEQICFVGHSHVPVAFFLDSILMKIQILLKTKFEISPKKRYIINVGSVGQPRDSDTRAAFGIYDSVSKKYKLVRKRYGISDTQSKMREAGLPDYLITRLKHGQ